MPDSLPIQSLTSDQVRLAVRDALASDDPYRSAAYFAGAVDWSRGETEPLPEVVELLGEIEQITTEYAEGDRTLEQLEAALEEMARPASGLKRRREAGD